MSGRIGSNLRSGLQGGLYIAVVFMVLATVVVVVRGADLKGEYNMSYVGLLALYAFGGLAGGLIVGVLMPLCRWTLGVMFVGFLATLPFGFAVSLILTPRSEWHTMIPLLPVVGSVVVGPLGGLATRIGVEAGRGEGSSPSSRRLWWYGIALGIVITLLWLDMHFHLINN